MIGKFTQRFSHFHQDQEGTSMTEFVMCLPVFIIIFIGIQDLAMMNVAGVRVKVKAAKSMWEQTVPPHKKEGITQLIPNFKRSMPVVAGFTAAGKVFQNKYSTLGNLKAMRKNIALGTKGSKGESKSLYRMTDGPSGVDPWKHAKLTFAKRMTDDDRVRTLPNGKKGLGIFNIARPFSLFGTRHAVAAGTRYGMVQGKANISGTVSAGFSYNAATTYDVLLSPVSMRGRKPIFIKEIAILGFSRLAAEEDRCLKSVLSITPQIDLKC